MFTQAIVRTPCKNFVKGLTTAAGLWVAAAVGVAVGANFYFLAILTTILTILIFSGLGLLEEKLLRKNE